MNNGLVAGIKIYTEPLMKDRIELSSGVMPVNILNNIECKTPVYVPVKPWRKPNKHELEFLIAQKNDMNDYQLAGIITIPSFLKKAFEKIKISDCTTHAEINRLTATAAFKKIVDDTVNYYEQWAAEKNAAIPHNIYLGEPNLPNNTYNRKDNYFIGLHLDSFEQKPGAERAVARNRICINLGKEPRYLLFYNIGYINMAKMTGFKDEFLQKSHNMYEVLYHFFDRYKNYPVIKIKINPYEAYIAPTENIIHDGCTDGCTQKDINLAIRGYYHIPIVEKSYFRNLKNFYSKIFKSN